MSKQQNIENSAASSGCASTACSGFFIVNRYDRPSEDNIAERRKNGYLYYVHPKLRNDKQYWAMNPDAPTPLEDFGIRILIEGGELHGKLVDPSRVTYLDGLARKWQGSDEFSFDYPNRLSAGTAPRARAATPKIYETRNQLRRNGGRGCSSHGLLSSFEF